MFAPPSTRTTLASSVSHAASGGPPSKATTTKTSATGFIFDSCRPRVWKEDVDHTPSLTCDYVRWIQRECRLIAKRSQSELDVLRRRLDLEKVLDNCDPAPSSSPMTTSSEDQHTSIGRLSLGGADEEVEWLFREARGRCGANVYVGVNRMALGGGGGGGAPTTQQQQRVQNVLTGELELHLHQQAGGSTASSSGAPNPRSKEVQDQLQKVDPTSPPQDRGRGSGTTSCSSARSNTHQTHNINDGTRCSPDKKRRRRCTLDGADEVAASSKPSQLERHHEDTFPPRFSVTPLTQEIAARDSLVDCFHSISARKKRVVSWRDWLKLHDICEEKARAGLFLIRLREMPDGLVTTVTSEVGGAEGTEEETCFGLNFASLRHYLCCRQEFPEENISLSTGTVRGKLSTRPQEKYVEWHLTKPGKDPTKEQIRSDQVEQYGAERDRQLPTLKPSNESQDLSYIQHWQAHLREKVGRIQLRVWLQGIQPREKLKRCPTDVFEYILSFLNPVADVIMNPLYLYNLCAQKRDAVYYQLAGHVLAEMKRLALRGEEVSQVQLVMLDEERRVAPHHNQGAGGRGNEAGGGPRRGGFEREDEVQARSKGRRIRIWPSWTKVAGGSEPMCVDVAWVRNLRDLEYLVVSVISILRGPKLGFSVETIRRNNDATPTGMVFDVRWDRPPQETKEKRSTI